MPRAATSVATTALALPEEKRCRLRSRTFWLRLPCRSTASTPWSVRASASSTAPSRVRVKMIVRPLASTRPDGGVDLLAEAADGQRVVGHRGDRAGVRVELVELRVAQVGADQLVDVAVERGAEQHPLRALGRHPDQLVDRRVEAEVAQVVGLVEDGQLDVVEEAVAVLQQVLEPARGGDDDVGALAELAGLLVVRRTAVHGDHLEVHGVGQRLDGLGDLVGQLAGRDDHHRTRVARAALAAGQLGEGRDAEGEGLAGAGLGAAQHVVAGHPVGDHGLLHRGRPATPAGEGGDELGRERGEDGHVGPSV